MSIEIRLVNLNCVYMINEIPCKGLLFHEDIKTPYTRCENSYCIILFVT